MMQKTKLGLEGHCPVCVVKMKKWMKGTKEHQVTYDGVTYYFPGDGPKNEFLKNPEAYVPVLNGDCIACYAMAKKRVPGNIRHAALHGGRLYLFPSDKEKQVFAKTPGKFQNTDLACKGLCSVCKIMANKEIPGKTNFTAMHNGFRYLFPSAREREMFVKEPSRFADKTLVGARKDDMANKTAAAFTFTGKTSCAGCEHGVKPIGAPEELGLAVSNGDGTIFVIEDAHSRWPGLYKDRFDGKMVRVDGEIIKRSGKFAWVSASSVTVL
jgi:YHS domain-containing protein